MSVNRAPKARAKIHVFIYMTYLWKKMFTRIWIPPKIYLRQFGEGVSVFLRQLDFTFAIGEMRRLMCIPVYKILYWSAEGASKKYNIKNTNSIKSPRRSHSTLKKENAMRSSTPRSLIYHICATPSLRLNVSFIGAPSSTFAGFITDHYLHLT